jgi:cytoskeleton protein RodZ
MSLAAGIVTPSATDSTAPMEPVQSVPPSQAAAATTMPPLTAPSAPASDQARIVLSANADAWLLVRDRSGQVLLNRVLHAGETWSVPLVPNLTLTTGNAGGTNIMVDGATAPPLGADGAVRRDIPLDPELLKPGKTGGLVSPVMTANSGATVAPRPTAQ